MKGNCKSCSSYRTLNKKGLCKQCSKNPLKIFRVLGYVIFPIILKALDCYSTFLFISKYGLGVTLVKFVDNKPLAFTAGETNPFFLFWFSVNPIFPYLFGMLFTLILFPFLLYLRKYLRDIRDKSLRNMVSCVMDISVLISLLGLIFVVISNFHVLNVLESFF